jgi:hydroxymethylglutaryl-CoA reductase
MLTDTLFSGFSKLKRHERFERLKALGALTDEDINFLHQGCIQTPEYAEKFIENVIGYFQLPLGVATNFKIDGKDYVIPMAVEETSIIAALSKSAKWIRQGGEITTSVEGDCIIGQIQIANVNDYSNLKNLLSQNKHFLIEQANLDVCASMVKRGGGVKDMRLRQVITDKGSLIAVIHLFMNPVDAMGANILNQVLEYLKTPIEHLTGETVTMCILSNLNDEKVTDARVVINDVEPELAMRIESASIFAENCPYRATTHNKGVLNGIDPILIATGNDWRAVEAGIHAYAARKRQYKAITTWRYHDNQLIGHFSAPIIVGTVGGVTSLHPTAQMALRMLNIDSANELSRVCAAVGLVQNLGALRALCTNGIVDGHMKLHIDNLTLSAGANIDETPLLKKKLEQWLTNHKRVSLTNAKQLLDEIRQTSVA